ncbi:hypothetical protein FB45DRAFT_64483 [Roridomyces roridus]|uniref:Uncharacterized protein n=1 Tax=Roridomyces roridus TaxID=1738132 RepID=A0AAD7F659_9AGAR|nr:hypothetical protein FB45DRAFT_64483 [Roridomyces roridus]
MVTTEAPDGVLPVFMPCNDQDPPFSFTSSHGFVCTTTNPVYPSPPPTATQPKRSVPLPHQFGGILDSPVVYIGASGASTLPSPPPTIPISTHALPPADTIDTHLREPVPSSSLLQPILEHDHESEPHPGQSQLLSPISPEWTTNRKPGDGDDMFTAAVDAHSPSDCVLMSQPSEGGYSYDDEILDTAAPFGRPALRPLDIPSYHDPDTMLQGDASGRGVLLGFPGVTPLLQIEQDKDVATSPFEYMPLSPLSPFPSDYSSSVGSDSDDFEFGSPLRSFTFLPSPELDDLDIDMDLGPAAAMSPSRRCVASLPSLEDDETVLDFTFDQPDSQEPVDVSMASPPSSPSMDLPTTDPSNNTLLLDLPPPGHASSSKTPSILDAHTPETLVALLPPDYPPAELEALLGVRQRARLTLAELQQQSTFGGGRVESCGLDDELRRSVPRDSGEPRRRRKRAKEVGKEVDALVGLVCGILPGGPPSSVSSSAALAEDESPSETERAKARAKGDKAGFAGLVSVPQLVARMIWRRRERCVRGIAEARGREQKMASPLRWSFGVEGDEDEPPPESAMDVDGEWA